MQDSEYEDSSSDDENSKPIEPVIEKVNSFRSIFETKKFK